MIYRFLSIPLQKKRKIVENVTRSLFISSSQDRKDENTGKYMFTFFHPWNSKKRDSRAAPEHFANCQFAVGQNQQI